MRLIMFAPASPMSSFSPWSDAMISSSSSSTDRVAFTPFVTGRVGSSARTCSASSRARIAPCGVPTSTISLPIEYMMTLGWLTSLATIDSRSDRHHCSKSRDGSKVVLPRCHWSKASSITSIPRRSQASSMAGEAGLWAARMALNPASLRSWMRRSSARAIDAAPSGPLSLWMQAPRSSTGSPLIRSPFRGSTVTVRMPWTVCTVWPASESSAAGASVVFAVYSDGESTFQSAGSCT